MKKILLSQFFTVILSFSGFSQNYIPVNYNYNGTPTYGVKIKTNLPFCSGCQMPTLIFEGYNYGTASTIGITLIYYIYGNDFYSAKASSSGGYTPIIKLANENSKVVVYIDDKVYYQRFTIRAFAQGMSEQSSWFQGWVVTDEPLSGALNVTDVPYQNSFAGNVGIGITSPAYSLSIKGANSTPQTLISSDGSNGIFFHAQGGSAHPNWLIGQQRTTTGLEFTPSTTDGGTTFSTPALVLKADGNIGIGTTTPLYKLHVVQNSSAGVVKFGSTHFNRGIRIGVDNANEPSIQGLVDNSDVPRQLSINPEGGNILIGKSTQTNSAYKLDVAGNIRANEVVVNTTGADFVFAPDYKLLTLPEVESFIKANKHLPDVISATEMKENGMNVSEMQTKLLQKIEELTLYTIEQNNKIIELEKQKDRTTALENKIKKMESALNKDF